MNGLHLRITSRAFTLTKPGYGTAVRKYIVEPGVVPRTSSLGVVVHLLMSRSAVVPRQCGTVTAAAGTSDRVIITVTAEIIFPILPLTTRIVEIFATKRGFGGMEATPTPTGSLFEQAEA